MCLPGTVAVARWLWYKDRMKRKVDENDYTPALVQMLSLK